MIDENEPFGPEGNDGITVQQLIVGLETFRVDSEQYLATVFEEGPKNLNKVLASGRLTLEEQVILYNEGVRTENLARKLEIFSYLVFSLTKTWEKETGTTITVEDDVFDTLKKYVGNKMVVSLQPAEDTVNG